MKKHIYLYGPSGSGKSTVGAMLANDLDMQFVDLDARITEAADKDIPTIMDVQGEPHFRDLETEELRRLADEEPSVVSLGGGALVRKENRQFAEETGDIVFLDADIDVLIDRLKTDEEKRPLLDGNLGQSLGGLLEKRKEHYLSFEQRINANGELPETVKEIKLSLGRFRLKAMGGGYDLRIQEGIRHELGDHLRVLGLRRPVLLVSDENVMPLYGDAAVHSLEAAGYQTEKLSLPAGESHKTIQTVSSIWEAALAAGLERTSTIIALGGGVVSDLAGFAAATYMRGCNWVAVPTTVLAMVDASLGGKTGCDLPQGKNLAGAFYPPKAVLTDPHVLSTLPEREMLAGLAEVVKHGIISDPELFAMVSEGMDSIQNDLKNILCRGIAVKAEIIEEDPYEKGVRAALNYGHTIGHAVEALSGYSLLHGEAVSIGMAAEARISEKLGISDEGLAEEIIAVLRGLGLPTAIPAEMNSTELVKQMRTDKKKSGGIVRFALPERIGKVVTGVEIGEIENILEETR